MKITDYLAIWGAVVATIVAAWNIYKDFLKRHRIKVSVSFDGLEGVFDVTVTNLSDRPTTIKTIYGHFDRRYKPRWLDRLVARFVKRSTTTYVFGDYELSPNPYKGPKLPFKLEPWGTITFLYEMSHCPEIEAVQLITADGRTWFCPRRDIERYRTDTRRRRASASPRSKDVKL